MTIREAKVKDIPVIIDFQIKMALETENITLDKSLLSRGIRGLFRDPAKGRYFVAEEKDQILGCLMTTYEWSDWRDGIVLWIQSVYVPEEFRRQGVYRKLYQHIQKMALGDSRLKGIRLYVDKTNRFAKKVYQNLGMNGDHYTVYEWMKKR